MIPIFEQIVAERGWTDPSKYDHGLYQVMENIEARLTRHLPRGAAFTLTTFQKKVINDPKFWRDWSDEESFHHLMVQGATSAGKTLVSELNILDTLQNNRKAVVLVPLKAMVHERTEQFREDMPQFNVYGASSDHMENDERIINGDYDVAVIVYEKFFSMLSQGSAKIMDRCGLLVVDELSMLSKEQRGPKLEMVLEIVREKHPDTRIMCLATCDCSTAKICQWLNISEPIVSTARPVPLEEHILMLDGTGIYRHIPADHELGEDAPAKLEEQLSVPGYRSDWRRAQKRKELLRVVLRKLYTQTPEARVLIFVGSQSATADIARFLKDSIGELFPPLDPDGEAYQEFMKKVRSCDWDDGQSELIENFLPHGIAYHHAGISTTLREVIEEEFQKPDSFMKIIVATETLTVGVNMPFDAMIMVTNVVPRGAGADIPLTRQEYRNYIGRAGRLGQNKLTGITYLFVENREDMNNYWNSYYSQEEVTSALTKATEKELAPFYLSLLTSRKGTQVKAESSTFTPEQLMGLFNTSLSKACSPKKQFDPVELYRQLHNAYLAKENRSGAKGALSVNSANYAVNQFGKHMAPYALSLDTCIDIYWFFFEGYKHGGLPMGITQEDIESDRYLLEILYHVCRHAEIANGTVLTYPDDDQRPDRAFRAKQLVLTQLRKLLEEKDSEGNPCNVLWCDSMPQQEKENNDLWLLSNMSNLVDETAILQAAMRAIILLHWTRGKTITEIRNITGIRPEITKLNSGDIERLAELVSFHLDAIHKCLRSAGAAEAVYSSSEALNAFYALQTRVKYGMPRELVQFANKHIYGLDRSRLLSLKKDADQMRLSPIQYLYTAPTSRLNRHLTLAHQTQLLQAMERRSSVREFDTLMEIVSKDAGTKLTSENADCLRAIADWDGVDPGELYQQMKALLKNEAFKSTRLGMDGDVHCISWTLEQRELCIGVMETESSPKTIQRIKNFFKDNPMAAKLILVPSKNLNDDWDTRDIETAVQTYGCTALLNTTFLAMILANTIRIDLGGGAELFDFLTDARGIYTKSEYKYFSLSNYIRHTADDADRPKFRLLYSHDACPGISDLKMALAQSKDLQNYEVLPWGSLLDSEQYNFCDCPTILVLERDHITHSESLNKFLGVMRRQNYENCLLLLDSEAAEQTWNSKEQLEGCGCNQWCNDYNKIRKEVVHDGSDAVAAIRHFLASWKHTGYLIGISYPHYEPRSAAEENDLTMIRKIAEGLLEQYGEHKILFDQFEPAKYLFADRGRERSLAAYRECKLDLILWNYWAKINVNCAREHEVISQQCEAGTARVIYLQSGQPSDPKAPEPHLSEPLAETQEILSLVRRLLQEMEE